MTEPKSTTPNSLTRDFASLSEVTRGKLANLSLLLMDVDGVLTDGRVIMADDGVESKQFSTRDGFGLVWVRKYGLKTGVISGRGSAATEQRCRNLRLDEIHLGQLKKLPVFKDIAARMKLDAGKIAFIGDDVIDLPVMMQCGISAAPMDAHDEVLDYVDIVLQRPGGHGAVRRFLDLWLMASGQWESSLKAVIDGTY
jgi:3-deoxy-D-manno-octulosonate 8-phosphate phosphatase (KDO 8-P phosphatase)